MHSHACVSRLVDDDSLARLIHIVVHPEVGCHTMQQHSVIRCHLRKLLILVTAAGKKIKYHMPLEHCNQLLIKKMFVLWTTGIFIQNISHFLSSDKYTNYPTCVTLVLPSVILFPKRFCTVILLNCGQAQCSAVGTTHLAVEHKRMYCFQTDLQIMILKYYYYLQRQKNLSP